MIWFLFLWNHIKGFIKIDLSTNEPQWLKIKEILSFSSLELCNDPVAMGHCYQRAGGHREGESGQHDLQDFLSNQCLYGKTCFIYPREYKAIDWLMGWGGGKLWSFLYSILLKIWYINHYYHSWQINWSLFHGMSWTTNWHLNKAAAEKQCQILIIS